jgi:26S proteasome regulatory subunit T1
MSAYQVSDFLDSAIRNRIAVRLLAEQHIALSRDLQSRSNSHRDHIGVVHMACSPKNMIKLCGSFVTDLCEATLGSSPEIVINGETDATFAYDFFHYSSVLRLLFAPLLADTSQCTLNTYLQRFSRTHSGRVSSVTANFMVHPPIALFHL